MLDIFNNKLRSIVLRVKLQLIKDLVDNESEVLMMRSDTDVDEKIYVNTWNRYARQHLLELSSRPWYEWNSYVEKYRSTQVLNVENIKTQTNKF